MQSHYAEILPVLTGAGARQPDPLHQVWDLEAGGCLALLFAPRQTGLSAEAKRAILSILLRGPSPVFFCQAEEQEAAGGWSEERDGVWRLPPDLDVVTLLASTSMECGDWQIVVGERLPDVPLPDLIRAPASDVTVFLQRWEVVVLVDSFHDDAMWRVAFSDEMSER